jgi:nickel/cobalt transporter (NicO) family protein
LKKLLLFSIFFPIFLSACALCALGIPKVHTSVKLDISNNELQTIHIQWEFTDKFTRQILQSYDSNLNDKLDSFEVDNVEDILTSYIAQRNYLTTISFYNQKDKDGVIEVAPLASGEKLSYINNKLLFNFSLHVKGVHLKPFDVVKIVFEDKDGFFDFRVVPKKEYELPSGLWVLPNTNFNFVFYKISEVHKKNPQTKKLSQIIPNINPVNKEIKEQKISPYLQFLQERLQSYTYSIKKLMKEENSPLKMFSLVLFSFLYGFFHALGPGHGKTLVGSYFLAKGGSWYGAFLMAIRIGIIHVLGAFVLVMASVYFIETFISKVVNDVTQYTSYFSAILIIVIAMWMLYQKLFPKITSHSQSEIKTWSMDATNQNSKIFVTTHNHEHHHHEGCSCRTCNALASKNNSWFVAFAAGIVPCPGTVVIFLLTFVFGNYYIGFLSAIAMAVGMSFVIFTSALLGQVLHVKLGNRFSFLPSLFEYAAIFFMLILGSILLFFPIIGT